MKQWGLTRTQWQTLSRFNFLPNPCPQRMLSQSMDIDCAHLTRVLAQLEKRQLVRSERCTKDKRACHITLTAEGQNVLAKVVEAIGERSENMQIGLDAQQRQTLFQLLDKVSENVNSQLEDVVD